MSHQNFGHPNRYYSKFPGSNNNNSKSRIISTRMARILMGHTTIIYSYMADVIAIACIVLDFKMDYSRLRYTTLYKEF